MKCEDCICYTCRYQNHCAENGCYHGEWGHENPRCFMGKYYECDDYKRTEYYSMYDDQGIPHRVEY